jgi:hypothetical protein
MATFDDLPFELLSIIAADSGLANRDRKQARLACGRLAAATTPFIFRRAYISWIKTDRDSFLALVATPHLAAHVEEVVWFEMGGSPTMRNNMPLKRPLLTICRLRLGRLAESVE